MQTLRSYVYGEWVEGSGEGAVLVNPATEEALAVTSSAGIDFAAAAAFGRDRGGPALRDLNFEQRAALVVGVLRGEAVPFGVEVVGRPFLAFGPPEAVNELDAPEGIIPQGGVVPLAVIIIRSPISSAVIV